MKIVVLTLTTCLLLAHTAMAQEQVISATELAKSFETITIFDGRTLNVANDLQDAFIQNNQLQAFELKNGEFLNRSDVIKIKFPSAPIKIFSADKGVDGGG